MGENMKKFDKIRSMLKIYSKFSHVYVHIFFLSSNMVILLYDIYSYTKSYVYTKVHFFLLSSKTWIFVSDIYSYTKSHVYTKVHIFLLSSKTWIFVRDIYSYTKSHMYTKVHFFSCHQKPEFCQRLFLLCEILCVYEGALYFI